MDLQKVKDEVKHRAMPGEAPQEDKVTKSIEKVTARIPSTAWLGLALGSMAFSAGLMAMTKRKGTANFVGMWVPTFLMFGLYNKIVKTQGSDIADRQQTMH